ncbi:HemK2/MTQ2 family protein methyltransferase [Nocardia sp. BMG51109]|uniref:HemK2/MTQ2 family protein methyltransferase n=1 Tax=Nocardia sp. BMG51109 TaxID=1056816 RepID=UPI000463E68D|nr:HemK2/MTQ2 family protein methyltransferase [Nocardia sp. BMG51109]
MIYLRSPDVYRPQADTALLMRAMAAAAVPCGHVLDVCTGTGAIALDALRNGAKHVTAVDISRSALLSAWLNSRLHGARIELVRGEFTRVLRHRRFDAVLANPPYVPGPEPTARGGRARAWNAGPAGRAVLDPLCRVLPNLLNPHGIALIVQSTLSAPDITVHRLRADGLKAAVVARETTGFGPVLRERAAWLERAGLIEPGQRDEELVVIRADRP